MDHERDERSPAVADAESAFATLGHDLRLRILLALWEAPGFSLSFSELRRAVGERDSGSFSYHLSKLVGHFVAETDDGYELQYPGHRVLDAIQSGVFHDDATVGPVELASDCQVCGESVTFAYGTDYVARVRCESCGERALEWPFDPGGTADRDPQAVVDAFDRRTRLIWDCALDGVCPFCAGRIDRTLAEQTGDSGPCVGVIEQLDRYDEFFAADHPAVVAVDCDRCSFYSFVPVGVLLLSHPTVPSRLHSAGVDVRETHLWDLGFVVDAGRMDVRSRDPTVVAVAILDRPESPIAVVDESLQVTIDDES